MHKQHPSIPHPGQRYAYVLQYALAASAAAFLYAAGTAHAADASANAKAQYQREMAVCNSGKSNQNVATCKVEAERALAESRRGGLTAESSSDYQQNALRRCAVFKGDDRTACEARMRAPEGVDGSAQSGGVLRENVTAVPAPAP